MRKIEKDLSEEFNLTREEIKTIFNFSYDELRRQMYSDGVEYEATGLGTFFLNSSRSIERELKNKITHKERNTKSPFNFEDTIMSIEFKLECKKKQEEQKRKQKSKEE